MTCYRSQDKWHSFVKKSLNEEELKGMANHLIHCPECRAIVSVIQETADSLAKSRVILSPPAVIKINVMLAIDKNKYKRISSSHLFELKNWGFSMVAGGLFLLALNLASWAPNFESGQVAELNNQIGKQIALPFDKISQAAYAAIVQLETITTTPQKKTSK
ncbi:MAG: hypothetical protein APF81_11400 [Desulfosporosinus sp. BRH_c37]|nr:MAG: hypothetical protein APF81_11400 [Desulfosporosinus sp. BRH_c37]